MVLEQRKIDGASLLFAGHGKERSVPGEATEKQGVLPARDGVRLGDESNIRQQETIGSVKQVKLQDMGW